MDQGPQSIPSGAHDPLGPLRHRDYRLFIAQVFLTAFVEKSQTLVIGWDLYERTGSALALGWMGLLQFLPVILLFLPAGQIADRFDRRWVLAVCLFAWGGCHAVLAYASLVHAGIGWIYIAAIGIGITQVVNRPSRDALMPQLLPRDMLGRAIAMNTTLIQTAAICAPALAGALIAVMKGAAAAYAFNVACALGALAALTGPVFTVVAGGLITVVFVAFGLGYFPALKRMGSLVR